MTAVRYPSADRLFAGLHHIALGIFPSPLVAAPRLGPRLGLDLLIKRDDLIGFAQAGTKTRALEYLLGDALHGSCDCVVGCGGLRSNFLPALAAAARVAGIDCHLVVFGDPFGGPRANLAMARAWGAEVVFTGDPAPEGVDDAAAAYASGLISAGRRPYVLPRGGATAIGVLGAAAVAELDEALGGIPPARIVVAAGSGGTAAGLAVGIAAHRWPTIVVATAVSRSLDATRSVIAELAAGGAQRLGTARPAPAAVEVLDAIGPGFHVASADGDAAAAVALATEGLVLDATYTAKAMAVTAARAAAEPFGRPGTTVFWHTGGLISAVSDLMAADLMAGDAVAASWASGGGQR